MCGERQYDQRLDEIIRNAGFPEIDASKLEQTSDWNIALFEEKCSNRRVAIWGAGDGNQETSIAAAILRNYATYLQGTVCIIDSNSKLSGTQFLGLPVIMPQDISLWNVECIVIATSTRWITEIAEKCMTYVRRENIIIPQTDMLDPCYKDSNFYLFIHLCRVQYENCISRAEKEKKLRELIACYLKIKDFAFAFRFMEEYQEQGFDESGSISLAKERIERLLLEMKEVIAQRDEDVLIFFPDRLNKKECDRIDMFSSLRDNALVFEDANATGLYTYESMAGIVNGHMPLDGEIYRGSMTYSVEEARIMKQAVRRQYHFYIETIPGYPIFRGNNVTVRFSAFVAEKLWNALCTLCEEKEKVFEYLYLFESHYPEVCGYHPHKSYEEVMGILKDNSKYYRSNYLDCLKYIDRVFAFYQHLFPEQMKIVIHSDHSFLPTDDEEQVGKRNKLLVNKQYCVEVPLIIKGNGMQGNYTGLFSMIDFPDLINQLVAGEALHIKERKLINYQMMPIHSRNWRIRLIKENMENYIDEVDIYASKQYICLFSKAGGAEVYQIKDTDTEIGQNQEGIEFLKLVEAYKEQKRRERDYADNFIGYTVSGCNGA